LAGSKDSGNKSYRLVHIAEPFANNLDVVSKEQDDRSIVKIISTSSRRSELDHRIVTDPGWM